MSEDRIDLGNEVGFATITIGGKDLSVDPGVELVEINDLIQTDTQREGIPFLKVICGHLEQKHGVKASTSMAHLFYRALGTLDEKVKSFFDVRHASLTSTGSTPGANGGAAEGSQPGSNPDTSAT